MERAVKTLSEREVFEVIEQEFEEICIVYL